MLERKEIDKIQILKRSSLLYSKLENIFMTHKHDEIHHHEFLRKAEKFQKFFKSRMSSKSEDFENS